MVGEIRDWETLDTAMEASMTGHLVFSTVHTNSSSETLTRVMNLGAQPYMITGTFNLIIAQRLARTIAPEYKKEINAKNLFLDYYENAVHALQTMVPEALEQEATKRKIPMNVITRFLQE